MPSVRSSVRPLSTLDTACVIANFVLFSTSLRTMTNARRNPTAQISSAASRMIRWESRNRTTEFSRTCFVIVSNIPALPFLVLYHFSLPKVNALGSAGGTISHL